MHFLHPRLLVLIETLWNVKSTSFNLSSSSNDVLIETLWNVKWCTIEIRKVFVVVLIETLWNVKKHRTCASFRDCFCFNRNIVECKVTNEDGYVVEYPGFNRNIVECKVFWRTCRYSAVGGFNRNIVECKGK